ncbi:hypothetical protein HDU98_009168 [Podochytrium sp. JEL0797]|nr:hypothetical protein HDU98_009168 [Podochytrium sp. JEL0797]
MSTEATAGSSNPNPESHTETTHRPKAKEVEPQMDNDSKPQHARKESEKVHLPTLPTLDHSKQHHSKPAQHGELDSVALFGPKHHEKAEPKPEPLNLFIGHSEPPHPDPHHLQPTQVPHPHLLQQPHPTIPPKHHAPPPPQPHPDAKHLPTLTTNPTHQQSVRQHEIQKQILQQQKPNLTILPSAAKHEIQFLQPIAHAAATGAHPPPLPPAHVNPVEKSTDSVFSSTSSMSNKESRRRGAHEKRAAEAVLARARRLQQVGNAGEMKRNTSKLTRVPGVVAAVGGGDVMFGVVGKNAPSNNATKVIEILIA